MRINARDAKRLKIRINAKGARDARGAMKDKDEDEDKIKIRINAKDAKDARGASLKMKDEDEDKMKDKN